MKIKQTKKNIKHSVNNVRKNKRSRKNKLSKKNKRSRKNVMRGGGIEEIIKKLKENDKSLTEFVITQGLIIESENITALLEAVINNTTLETLHINKTIDEKEKLVEVLKQNKNLTTLNISNSKLDFERDVDFRNKFTEALKNNKTLKSLNISSNNIGQNSSIPITEALKNNKTLISLDISKNPFNIQGNFGLAEELKNNNINLKSLNISGNHIGDNGANELANALQTNNTLEELNISSNDIGDEAAEELAKALKNNKTLTSLDISFNQFGDVAAEKLAKALNDNTTLTTLNMRNNNILNVNAIEKLENILKRNIEKKNQTQIRKSTLKDFALKSLNPKEVIAAGNNGMIHQRLVNNKIRYNSKSKELERITQGFLHSN